MEYTHTPDMARSALSTVHASSTRAPLLTQPMLLLLLLLLPGSRPETAAWSSSHHSPASRSSGVCVCGPLEAALLSTSHLLSASLLPSSPLPLALRATIFSLSLSSSSSVFRVLSAPDVLFFAGFVQDLRPWAPCVWGQRIVCHSALQAR